MYLAYYNIHVHVHANAVYVVVVQIIIIANLIQKQPWLITASEQRSPFTTYI